eukprot:4269865-Amphidinium_carterae.1
MASLEDHVWRDATGRTWFLCRAWHSAKRIRLPSRILLPWSPPTHCDRPSSHWVTLWRMGASIWELDSLRPSPRLLSQQEVALQLSRFQWTKLVHR